MPEPQPSTSNPRSVMPSTSLHRNSFWGQSTTPAESPTPTIQPSSLAFMAADHVPPTMSPKSVGAAMAVGDTPIAPRTLARTSSEKPFAPRRLPLAPFFAPSFLVILPPPLPLFRTALTPPVRRVPVPSQPCDLSARQVEDLDLRMGGGPRRRERNPAVVRRPRREDPRQHGRQLFRDEVQGEDHGPRPPREPDDREHLLRPRPVH